jgi:hypothetical protein
MLRTLNIEPVLNGFIVQCGCQRLAYTNIDELISDLGSYLREPEATEKRILKDKGINRKHTLGDTAEQMPAPQVGAGYIARADCAQAEPSPMTATGIGATCGIAGNVPTPYR